jgi:hypothetical protein
MANDTKVVRLKPKSADPEAENGLPEGVRIGPYDYTIRAMDRIEVLESGAMGMCDEEFNVISLAVDSQPIHLAETVIHEILHALWGAADLPDEGPVDEERIVTALAKGILQVARDNPAVLAFIAQQASLPR